MAVSLSWKTGKIPDVEMRLALRLVTKAATLC